MAHLKKKLRWRAVLAAAGILAVAVIGIAVAFLRVFPADPEAAEAFVSDGAVTVIKTGEGWLFDGPSTETALIFYPGGKVEATAYGPFLHQLAREGVDAFLVEMPLTYAVFGVHKADKVREQYSYDHWYVGGHSLGGVVSVQYAADSEEGLDGVILLAAYPHEPFNSGIRTLLLCGSEDTLVNAGPYRDGKQELPPNVEEHRITGGNHSQFANYGLMPGDKPASISREAQQIEAIAWILSFVGLK